MRLCRVRSSGDRSPLRWPRSAAVLFVFALIGIRAVAGSAAAEVHTQSDPQGPARAAESPTVLLRAQQLTLDASGNGSFVLDVEADNLSSTQTRVVASMHRRVKDLEALRAAFDGRPLASTISLQSAVTFSADERRAGNGTRRLSFALGPVTATCPQCVEVTASGVYPVRVELRTDDGEAIDTFTTAMALIDARKARLRVGLAVPVHMPLPGRSLSPLGVAAAVSTIEALASHPDIALSVLPTPEILDRLSLTTNATNRDDLPNGPLVETLRTAVRGREVIGSTYVDMAPELRDDPTLASVLTAQRSLGREVVRDRLGVDAVEDLALVEGGVPNDEALDRLGIQRMVVSSTAVGGDPVDPLEPLLVDPGAKTGRETTARPTVVRNDELPKLLVGLRNGHAPNDDDVLAAHHASAMLSVVANSDPAKGLALVLPSDLHRTTLDTFLVALRENESLTVGPVSGLFDRPLQVHNDGTPVVREPSDVAAIKPSSLASKLASEQRRVSSYRSMYNISIAEGAERAFAVVLGRDMTDQEREESFRNYRDTSARTLGTVALVPSKRTTLTSRRQTLSVPIVNDPSRLVEVVLVVESDNLEITGAKPDPSSRARAVLRKNLQLSQRITTERIELTTRGPGSFSYVARLQAPDGYPLSSYRYTVRSTSIGATGKFLSLGSLLALALWWVATIVKRRRHAAMDRHPASMTSDGAALVTPTAKEGP